MSAGKKIKIKRFPISVKVFVKGFRKNVKMVSCKLDAYIEDPNEENIHDIRTSIRRLEVSCRLLPKKMRRRTSLSNYVAQCKELFRINSTIRNYDIINTKLLKYSGVEVYEELTRSLKLRRNSELRKARRIAFSIRELRLPQVSMDSMSGKKLQKRFDKVVYKLNDRIKHLMPIVITDMKKVDELHEMRKNYKKLRYFLELSDSKKASKVIDYLQGLQDILGSIHDNDVMIEYLKNVKVPYTISHILNDEIEDRNQKYHRFVELFRTGVHGSTKVKIRSLHEIDSALELLRN